MVTLKNSMLILAGILFVVVSPVSAEGSGHAASGQSFESLLASADIVLNEEAKSGARIAVAENPSEIVAGNSLTRQELIQMWLGDERLFTASNLKAFLDENLGKEKLPPGQQNRVSGVELIVNGEFGSLDGWTYKNAIGGLSSFGEVVASPASNDNVFAAAHTRLNEVQGFIEQTVHVKNPREAVFNVLYNFITMEFPLRMDFPTDDFATVTISDNKNSIKFQVHESKSTSSFSSVNIPRHLLAGLNGTQVGGQTGWLETSKDLSFNPGNYKIRIEVNDVWGTSADAAILVDRISLK